MLCRVASNPLLGGFARRQMQVSERKSPSLSLSYSRAKKHLVACRPSQCNLLHTATFSSNASTFGVNTNGDVLHDNIHAMTQSVCEMEEAIARLRKTLDEYVSLIEAVEAACMQYEELPLPSTSEDYAMVRSVFERLFCAEERVAEDVENVGRNTQKMLNACSAHDLHDGRLLHPAIQLAQNDRTVQNTGNAILDLLSSVIKRIETVEEKTTLYEREMDSVSGRVADAVRRWNAVHANEKPQRINREFLFWLEKLSHRSNINFFPFMFTSLLVSYCMYNKHIGYVNHNV